MRDVIAELKKQDLRDRLKVVGGVPTSREYADEVGADARGKVVIVAMQKAREMDGGKNG